MFNLNKLPRRAVKKIKISVRKLAYEKAKHASTNSMSLDRNVNFSRKGQAKCVPESGERKGVLTITHLNINGFFKKKILQKMTNKCKKKVILLIYFSKDVKIYSFEQKSFNLPPTNLFSSSLQNYEGQEAKKRKKKSFSCTVLLGYYQNHDSKARPSPTRHRNFSLRSATSPPYHRGSRPGRNSFRLGKFGLSRLRDSKEWPSQPSLASQPA